MSDKKEILEQVINTIDYCKVSIFAPYPVVSNPE